MSFKEMVAPVDFTFIESGGKEYLFPELKKDVLMDRYIGKGYPCSGMEDFVCTLAKEYWEQGTEVLKRLEHSPAFHTTKSKTDEAFTIALYYRNIINGGAQRVTAMLADLWASRKEKDGKAKYKIVLITDESNPEEEEKEALLNEKNRQEFRELLADADIDFSRFESKDLPEYTVSAEIERAFLPPYFPSAGENYRSRYQAWMKIIETYSIDIVVTGMWSNTCTLWDMLSVKGHSSHPAFVLLNHSFLGSPFLQKNDAALRLMHMYSFCDAVVTLSEMDRAYVESFAGRARYIPNPIAPKKASAEKKSEPDTLLWVGRFSSEKNPADVLKMVKLVSDERPQVKLYMVGTGKPKMVAEVLTQIQELALEDHVILPGFTMDVEEYYRKASVFISTSLLEGFPTTTAEAFSYELPIVEYEMPWLAFSRDQRGIISVPQGDYSKMAEEVCRLLADPERILKMGKEGNEKLSEFRQIDIGIMWDQLFHDIFYTEPRKENADPVLKYLTEFQQLGKKNVTDYYTQKLESLQKKNEKLEVKIQRVKQDKADLRARLKKEKNEKNRLQRELAEYRKYGPLTKVKRKVKKLIGK